MPANPKPADDKATAQDAADRTATPPDAQQPAADPPRSAADQRHIDALERRAQEAEEKAQAAQERADELAANADAAANAVEDAGGPKDHHCPDCGTRLDLYPEPNLNPHKAGQGFCRKCQARKPLGH